MRAFLFIIPLLLAVYTVHAQHNNRVLYSKNTPVKSPEIKLINASQTINIDEEDLGKTISVSLRLSAVIKIDKPAFVSIQTNVLNIPEEYVHITSLNDGIISIPPDQYNSSKIIDNSLYWIAFGILNLEITAGKNAKDKSVLIIKANDESSGYNILIHIVRNKKITKPNSDDAAKTGKASLNDTDTNSIVANDADNKMAHTPPTATTVSAQTTPLIKDDAASEKSNPAQKEADIKPDPDTAKPKENKASSISIMKSPETVLQVLYTKSKTGTDEAQDTVQLHVIKTGCKAATTDTITFEYQNLSFPDKSLEIIDPQQTITWDSTCQQMVVLHVKKYNIDTLKNDEMASIKLKDGDGEHVLRLSSSKLYIPKPFWMELGTNFDLLDKIETNNLYGGVFMFKKDIARVSKYTAFSFSGGFYESKSSSSLNSSDSGLIYRDNSSFLRDSTNRYPYYRDTGSFNTTTSVKSIGLFFSPHYRFTRRPADENGFHMFASFYAEMLWQRVKVVYDYSDLHRAQTNYVTSLPSGTDSLRGVIFRENEKEYDFRSHYLGIGLPIYIKDEDFTFYLNTVFGFSTQKFILINSLDTSNARLKFPFTQTKQQLVFSHSSFAQPVHNWTPFYLLQFRLNEEKYGASITGEIRGFLLKNTKPVITLTVSKKFNLADLLKNIVAPFGL